MQEKHIRFADLLEIHLSNTIKDLYLNESLTPELLYRMSDSIRRIIFDVFAKSRFVLTNETQIWLANQYFKRIKLNGTQFVNDIVVFNDYNLSDFPYEDIRLLYSLFNETALGEEIRLELVRRTKNATS